MTRKAPVSGEDRIDYYEEWHRRPDTWLHRTRICLEAVAGDTPQRREMLDAIDRIQGEREKRRQGEGNDGGRDP